jgi:hypothetical protein
MKKLTAILALLPAVALAAPQGPPARGAGAGQGAGPDDPARMERMQKRVRLARTLGLAEALDLDDAGAIRARDVMAKFDERRAPLRKQVADNVRVLQDAARGDKDAGAKVDQAVQHLREARTQLQALKSEMFQQLSQGLSPQKKAKAALFLATFHARAERMMMHHGPRGGPGAGQGGGRGAGRGMGGMGMGSEEMQPGAGSQGGRQAMMMGDGGDEPDTGEWFADE